MNADLNDGVDVEHRLASDSPEPSSDVASSTKLPERTVWDIARDVIVHGIEPGSMLQPEAQMAAEYNVGRATLREALRILEHLGLILLQRGPQGGPRWIGVDSRQYGKLMTAYLHLIGATFGQVLDARMVLEPVMARLAAANTGASRADPLRAFLEGPQPNAELLQSKHLAATTEFHGLVASMSGNKVLDLLAQSVRHIYADRQHGLTFPEAVRQRVLDEHVAIAECIQSGDVIGAEHLMRQHMEEFGRYSNERYPGMLSERIDWH